MKRMVELESVSWVIKHTTDMTDDWCRRIPFEGLSRIQNETIKEQIGKKIET